MTRRLLASVAVIAVVGAAGAWYVARSGAGEPRAPRITRVVPEGVRIKVEVLNATDTRGLARQATFALRDAGFDVVYFGNSSTRSDISLILDRSGHPQWAELARRAMAPARVETKPDSSHFLDLTVLIGSKWTPPPRSLYP